MKYHQINSSAFKGVQAVRECRGLILSKELEVLSLAFKRFFNVEEVEADPIDFKIADILKKADGSCMTKYWDEHINQWCVQTTGTAEANTPVGCHDMTFADLFWEVFYGTHMSSSDNFDKNKNYVFELCTIYNQVVALHEKPKLVLLNVRNLDDMSEVSYEELIEIGNKINIPAVESYKLNSIEEIREMIVDMSAEEEGFVAYDGKFRVKIKNAKYVLKHKTETDFSQKDIFTILKENEKDEFLGLVKRYEELYDKAEKFWLQLLVAGYKFRDLVSKYLKMCKTKKDFALYIQPHINEYNRPFTAQGYQTMDKFLKSGTINSFDPEEILRGVDNKKLNEMFNKYKNK